MSVESRMYIYEYETKERAEAFHVFKERRDIHAKYVISAVEDYYKSRTGNYELAFLGTLVDVGCGSGTVTVELAKLFQSVIAVDISEDQIKMAKRAFPDSKIEFKVGDAENIPVGDECADVITCIFSAHYYDTKLFVQQCKRVLKPQGVVVLFGYEISEIVPGRDLVISPSVEPDVTHLWQKVLAESRDYACVLQHPNRHVPERYAAIYEEIEGVNKYRDDGKSYEVEMTLSEMRSKYFSIPFWAMEKPSVILKEFWKGLKKQWKVEDKDDDDIILKLTHSVFMIIISK